MEMKLEYEEKKVVFNSKAASSLVKDLGGSAMEIKLEYEEEKPVLNSEAASLLVKDLSGSAMEIKLEYEDKKPVLNSKSAPSLDFGGSAIEMKPEYEEKEPVFNFEAISSALKELGDAFGIGKTSQSPKINMQHQPEKPVVVLSGTAAARVGPRIGTVDIGISESAYLFRVALPGVHRDDSELNVYIEGDGRVNITGVLRDFPILKEMSGYEMKLKQLASSGPFSVSFNLPGPVDPRLCNFDFRSDGILEVVVKAKMG